MSPPVILQYYLYIVILLKYRLIFVRVSRVFDELLCESNTERRVEISAGISKKAPNNVFAVKLKNLTLE